MLPSDFPAPALCAVACLLGALAALGAALCWALYRKHAAESAARDLAERNDLLRVRLYGERQRHEGALDLAGVLLR